MRGRGAPGTGGDGLRATVAGIPIGPEGPRARLAGGHPRGRALGPRVSGLDASGPNETALYLNRPFRSDFNGLLFTAGLESAPWHAISAGLTGYSTHRTPMSMEYTTSIEIARVGNNQESQKNGPYAARDRVQPEDFFRRGDPWENLDTSCHSKQSTSGASSVS